jgi:tetratricopeptide (TPR) repeat protein
MMRSRLLSLSLIAAGLGVASLASAVMTPSAAYAAEGLSPEVGKLLQAAQEQAKKGKFKEALEEVSKAEAASKKTAYENLVIAQMRGSIAQQAGDTGAAIAAYEAVLKSGAVEGPNSLKLVQAIAGLYNEKKDYPNAIQWLQRYRKEGGTDPAMRTALIGDYFEIKDYQNAAKEQLDQINGEEKAGQAAPEAQYQLLMNCYISLKDNAAYAALLERVIQKYPKPDYWANIIHQVQVKPGFNSTRLGLDVSRLKLATGNLKTGQDYRDMIQEALQEKSTAEAKELLDKAFAANLLGTGDVAPRDNKLRDFVTKTVADDQASIDAKSAEAAANKEGQAMVDYGFDYVWYGQTDKGTKLMEDGIAADKLKHPDDAKLLLGIAYFHAGKKDKALAALKSVGGTDGTADLARVWTLVINTKPAS